MVASSLRNRYRWTNGRRRLRPTTYGRFAPDLWPVRLALPLALAAAASLGLMIYGALRQGLPDADPLETLRATIAIVAFLAAVLAGVYAYRKQLLAEGDAHRADAQQLAERYAKAAEQLGHEKAAVRLAGVLAMARLADDWREQRQTCVDVLCAYIRMPYEPDVTPLQRPGEREVRQTIVRAIRDRLQDPDSPSSWCGLHFDFTGATFDGGTFNKACFTGGVVSFERATFASSRFSFAGATFARGCEIRFYQSKFTGGDVDFFAARFGGASMLFDQAEFADGTASFKYAKVTEGELSFRRCTFGGCRVSFDDIELAGGRMSFGRSAILAGTLSFARARLETGRVGFTEARLLGGAVSFLDAKVTAGVLFFDRLELTETSVDWGPLPTLEPTQ